ncbi:MAG: SPOR domain-containing protein [Gammaproteobacteria bacterium]|nr:SPOR domain-containing protein [Gammaproteobacteria bacterium]
MDSTLKQRLIGAAVLAALAIIFLPMLLKGPDVREPDAAEVPLSMPASPSQDFETRELPLTVPDAVPPGGAVGMAPGSTPPSTPEQPVPDSAVADVAPPAATDADAVVSAPAPAAPATATPVAAVPVKPAVVEAPLPPSEAARVGAGRHVVNVGTFANLANANALASKLRGAGLPVIAERISLSSGTAMRLRVGPYATRTSAEAARLRADQATGTRSTVIVLDAPVAASTPATKPTPAPTAAPAKAPTAATTQVATPAPAVASSGFAVQLSAPSVEADAIALRDKARAAGFSSFVQRIETANGTRFRVRVGPVADRVAATTLRDEVNAKLGTGGIVVTNP